MVAGAVKGMKVSIRANAPFGASEISDARMSGASAGRRTIEEREDASRAETVAALIPRHHYGKDEVPGQEEDDDCRRQSR